MSLPSVILFLACFIYQAYTFRTSLTTIDYLSNYDITIVQQLTKPEVEKFKDICENVKQFNMMLRDILAGFKEKQPGFSDLAKALWVRGKPSFTEFVDFEHLESTYRWKSYNVRYFFKLMSRSNKLWQEFRIKCEENKGLCAPHVVVPVGRYARY